MRSKKKTTKCICHSCEIEFDIVVSSVSEKRPVPDICPFCGDVCDLRDETSVLKTFDDYDNFDDEKYYTSDDDFDDED